MIRALYDNKQYYFHDLEELRRRYPPKKYTYYAGNWDYNNIDENNSIKQDLGLELTVNIIRKGRYAGVIGVVNIDKLEDRI